MITEIKNLDDVRAFAFQLVNVEKLSFHPDDDFNDYVCNTTMLPLYTKQEAVFRNKLMDDCFDICEKNDVEIYQIMLDVISKEIGIGEFYEMA